MGSAGRQERPPTSLVLRTLPFCLWVQTLEAVVCAAVVLGVRIFHLGSRYIGAGTLEAWIEKGQLETARVEVCISGQGAAQGASDARWCETCRLAA